MFPFPFPFKLNTVVIIGFITVLFLIFFSMLIRMNFLKHERNNARYERDIALSKVKSLSIDLEIQNKSILQLKEQSKKSAKKLNDAQNQARLILADKKRYQKLIKEKWPDDCDLALEKAKNKIIEIANG